MRLSFLIIIIFSISCLGFSQQVHKGSVIKDRQFLIDKKELTASDSLGNFVSIRPHTINGTLRNYFVELYENLDFTNRIEIETKGDTDILKTFLYNGKSYVFLKEKNGKTISLILNSIDIKTKKISSQLLYSVSKEEDSSIFKALKNNFFIDLDIASEITLSFPVLNNKVNHVIVKIFSKDLQLKSTFTISPNASKSYKNIKFLTTMRFDDKIYTLFQVNNSEDDNFYELIKTSNNKTQSLKIQIPSKSYELINSKIKNNHFIISGIFSNVKKGGYKGFTYYNIDLNTFTLNSSKQSLFQNKKAETYFSGFFKDNRSIDIKDIFINDALETYIVGQFYIKKRQSLPVGMPIASFSFSGFAGYITINPISTSYKVFDDLLIGKIKANGSLEWDNLLQLRQTEKITSKSNKRDSSTFTFFANEQINILINGFIEEKKGRLFVKQDKRPNKTNFYNITVNPYGGISQNIIFSNANSETIFRAENSIKSNNIIHILGQGNMRKQLLMLKF
ncbi:hypothetical protein [Winogradskyella sp.]|jgi:hypothetical protein|uniref:hypothetical protein n=1 Tax=Winogradskyella sp. TaxID=1883156 RepID=UPI0025FE859B|nr:hypothetical protein [Winogradskyella sp.]MCT4629860.1 hypothetical protein [Winogradskyella sp.]